MNKNFKNQYKTILAIFITTLMIASSFGSGMYDNENTSRSWSIETVDSSGIVGEWTSIALDSNNQPHISYYDYTNTNLKYAKWTGSSWSKETVDSSGDVGPYTSIALDSNNWPHISYFDNTNFDLKYAKWTGSSWSKETVDSSGFVGAHTSIALDSNNRAHISYLDASSDDLKYAKWTGSSWSKETVDSSGIVGYYTSIALDSNNRPHISYHDLSNNDLKYAKWTGSSWSKETVDSSGIVGQWTSIALDSNNQPHISHYDYTNTNLKYAKWTGSSWSKETVDLSGNVGKYTSIALDSNNRPHISYYDVTNGDLKYAKKSNQPPIPDFTWSPYPNPKVGETVTFDASASYDPDGYIVIWAWDFENDGIDDAWGEVVTHIYDTAMTYTVKLWIKDNDGGSALIRKDVTVDPPGNLPPNAPITPSGPTPGYHNTPYTYSTSATDPDGDNVYYWFDWGDGSNSGWIGPFNSGQTGSATHTWSLPGYYYVKAKAKDVHGAESGWSPSLQVYMDNRAPNTPITPSGPTSGYVGTSYTYYTSTTDPDGCNVYYMFDWDDGTNSGWVGPYASGETGEASHSWSLPDTYYVKAKAKDVHGAESGWSPTKTVVITTQNQPPDPPSNPNPSNGAINVPLDTNLSCSVSDPNGDLMDVQFFWSDNTLIGTVYNVGNGVVSFDLPGMLTHGTYYQWYVRVDDNINPPVTSPTWGFTTTTGRAWTFIVYLNGDNDLENASVAKFNAMEMAAGNTNANIVVLFDRIPGYNNSNGDWTGTRLYKVKYDAHAVNFATYTEGVDMWTNFDGKSEHNMGDPYTLETFVLWSIAHYPGNHYCLIIADHGTGWIFDDEYYPTYIGVDVTDGDYLSVFEVGDALENIIAASYISEFDIIYLDACLMQTIEVNYELRNYGGYLVGNENLGWMVANANFDAYRTFMNADHAGATTTSATLSNTILTETFAEFGTNLGLPLIVSKIDLHEINTLANAVNNLAVDLQIEIQKNSAELDRIELACVFAQSLNSDLGRGYVNYTGQYDASNPLIILPPGGLNGWGPGTPVDNASMDVWDDYLDLRHVCEQIIQYSQNATIDNRAQQVINALNNAIVTFQTRSDEPPESNQIHHPAYWNLDDCQGLSIYFPICTPVYTNLHSSYNSVNLEFVDDHSWDAFLGTYLDLGDLTGLIPGDNKPPNSPTTPIPENNTVNVSTNPMLSVLVTDPDGDTMDVSFYNASDDSLIDTDINVANNSIASVTWNDLAEYTTYFWYAVADDGEYTNQSDTWNFTTGEYTPNLENTFIIGLIENKNSEGDFICLSGKLIYIAESGVQFLFSGEEVIISMDYLGYVGPRFIIGFFKAAVVSPP